MGDFKLTASLFTLQPESEEVENCDQPAASIPNPQKRRGSLCSPRLLLPSLASSRRPILQHNLLPAICRIKLAEAREVRPTQIGINARFKLAFPEE